MACDHDLDPSKERTIDDGEHKTIYHYCKRCECYIEVKNGVSASNQNPVKGAHSRHSREGQNDCQQTASPFFPPGNPKITLQIWIFII